ncbi:hypothetical protein HDU96_001921 [Phlyctochytrium bullatum]|nr:hypothetical protein HDU96_001921 [Phlyctochytrium bullatum]
MDPLLIDEKGKHVSPPSISHYGIVIDSQTKASRNVMSLEEEEHLKEKRLREAALGKSLPLWVERKHEAALEDEDDVLMNSIVKVVNGLNIERGILFINSNVSAVRVTNQLQNRGLRAMRILDAVSLPGSAAAESPIEEKPLPFAKCQLLVVPEFIARGLDLPEATHVIIVGPPSSPASYLHMSGRVGRFGRAGSAITILGGRRFEGKLLDTWKLLGITPEKLDPKIAEGI